jgi:hypothetical protein
MKTMNHVISPARSRLWNTLLSQSWLLVIVLLLPINAQAAGVTILLHGWNPSGGAPAWLASLRDDIAQNFLGNEQNYGTITITRPAASLVATCNPWNFEIDASTNGEIIVILDWSAVANHLTGGPTAQAVAAVVVDKLVTSQNGKRPLAELPIHLIGHSRGGGMVCELARLLGERGIVVDHLTPLDPHPLTTSDPQPLFPLPSVIDTPAAIYQNVVFADVYSQTNEYPTGQYLAGGYNRLWGLMAGGYHLNSSPYADHRNVYLLYQGTVDLGNPVNNGEATMGATERAAWFNTYENNGDATGFTYSRLDGQGNRASTNTPVVGGDAIRAGLQNAVVFGGGGARSSLTWSAAVWPNVAQFDVLTNGTPVGSGTCQITVGTTQQLRYVYLDYDSGCTVTLHLDTDRNPYNSNDVAVISTQVVASATGSTYTQNTVAWDTRAMSAGTTGYLYAKATDGSRTRYLYAIPVLVFSSTVTPLVITSTAGAHGDISPSGTVVVPSGGTTNFTIIPNAYYHVADVTTNGVSVGAVTNFAWANITATGTIHATFAADLAPGNTPHWWLAQYGWTNNFAVAEGSDTDTDGHTAGQEWVADTIPTSFFSVLRVTQITNLRPFTVTLNSSSNRLYTLQGQTNLTNGAWFALSGQSDVPGTGGPLTLCDTNTPSGTHFYRVQVRLP